MYIFNIFKALDINSTLNKNQLINFEFTIYFIFILKYTYKIMIEIIIKNKLLFLIILLKLLK